MATNDPSQVLPATNDPFSGEGRTFGGSECNNVAVLQQLEQYTVLILAGMHVHHDQLYIVSCMAGVAGG